jgi:hypothetical protein
MPKQKWHCNKCDHSSDTKNIVKSCEEGHQTVIKAKIREDYSEMGVYPHKLVVTFKDGKSVIYVETFS